MREVSLPELLFNWPGPWLARARDVAGSVRPVVMYGFASGVVFDPLGGADGIELNELVGYDRSSGRSSTGRPAGGHSR